ncbi:MAG: hypothetical protein ACU0GG_03305 [Paracoccaceae bacterium]
MTRYLLPLVLASFAPMGSTDIRLPPVWLGIARLLMRGAVIVVLALGLHMAMHWATERAADREGLMIGLLALLLLTYALLVAVPFMPGIEIGISLLVLQGASIAPFVYLATVFGLVLAFVVGRSVPLGWLRAVFADLRLRRACHLLDRLGPMSGAARLALLTAHAPGWVRPLVGRWRYGLLAALINMPGNVIFGGGGGLAMTAGLSRVFHPGWVLLTVALAVAPVPFLVWMGGADRLLP